MAGPRGGYCFLGRGGGVGQAHLSGAAWFGCKARNRFARHTKRRTVLPRALRRFSGDARRLDLPSATVSPACDGAGFQGMRGVWAGLCAAERFCSTGRPGSCSYSFHTAAGAFLCKAYSLCSISSGPARHHPASTAARTSAAAASSRFLLRSRICFTAVYPFALFPGLCGMPPAAGCHPLYYSKDIY